MQPYKLLTTIRAILIQKADIYEDSDVIKNLDKLICRAKRKKKEKKLIDNIDSGNSHIVDPGEAC
jgi:hypothetical protein